MAKDLGHRFGRSAPEKVEIPLRNGFRWNIVSPPDLENMVFQLREGNGFQAQSPYLACRMEQIQMRQQLGYRPDARHLKTRLQQRPIKAFPVKRNQHTPLVQAIQNFKQERALVSVILHKVLLNNKTVVFPPADANQKRVGSRASGKTRGFRVKKQPLPDIACRF
jgi:hypothetical protein